MNVKYRYAFGENKVKIIHLLDDKKIVYKNNYGIISFEIYEDNNFFHVIKNVMENEGIPAISTAIYTKKEIGSAEWLTVYSSWQRLYPQPQDDMKYKFTTYDATNYCEGNPNIVVPHGDTITAYRKHDAPLYNCNKGLVQKENFVLKQAPNWGARNFMMLHWVGDELFISPKAEEVLRNSNLSGFDYYAVTNKSNKPFDNVKQLFINNYVAEGFCADAIERTYTCPICGFTKYHPKAGHIRFHKEIFEGNKNDIVKTTDKFWPIACDSLILITHKFYKVITEAKLDRGLIFEPVELV